MSRLGQQPRAGAGQGFAQGTMQRIVIAFNAETFAQIRRRAVAQKTSFAEQVRLLVEWGLEQEHRP